MNTNATARQIARSATGAVAGLVSNIVKAARKDDAPAPAAAAPVPPSISKQARLIELLKRAEGATLAELVYATGWQAHSVRGAISGSLKKKLGLAVVTEKVEGRGRVYRLAAED